MFAPITIYTIENEAHRYFLGIYRRTEKFGLGIVYIIHFRYGFDGKQAVYGFRHYFPIFCF